MIGKNISKIQPFKSSLFADTIQYASKIITPANINGYFLASFSSMNVAAPNRARNLVLAKSKGVFIQNDSISTSNMWILNNREVDSILRENLHWGPELLIIQELFGEPKSEMVYLPNSPDSPIKNWGDFLDYVASKPENAAVVWFHYDSMD